MSILIKDMQMPTGCISCDFCNPFTDEPYCRRLMRRTPKVTRLKDCPLIELPDHGDLIDQAVRTWSEIGKLVRCKDCEFYTEDERWCRRLGLVGAFDPNGYCSHAERSEDETN